MKKKLEKLIDLKSIITVMLILVLVISALRSSPMNDRIFGLYSNVTTMVMTYFFTKKSKDEKNDTQN